MKYKFLVLSFAFILLFSGNSYSADGFWYPSGKEITEVPKFANEKKSDDFMRAVCVYGKAPLFKNPSASNTYNTMQFMTKAFVAANKNIDGQEFYLLVEKSNDNDSVKDVFGWISKKYISLYFGIDLRAKKNPESNIHRKCMLINTLEKAREVKDLQEMTGFFDRPDQDGVKRTQRALFEIYYIFDETDSHVLLGTQSSTDGDFKKNILGWVKKERICPWNTREALEFNKNDISERTVPARIFSTQDNLKAYLNLQFNLGEKSPNVLAEEDLTVKSWKEFQMRYPLVSDQDDGFQGFVEKVGNFSTKIYKIGFIGDVYGENRQEVVLKASEVSILQRQVQELKDQMSTIQIIFCIDATFGMDSWFKTGSKAVKDIINGVQNIGEGIIKPKVEFSVNFYRDKEDGDLVFEGNKFTDKSIHVLDLLEKQRATGGGKPLDAVFSGIVKSLEPDLPAKMRSKYKPNSIKLFILIGDDGNDPLDNEFNEEVIAKALYEAAGNQPIGFYAISVGDQGVPAYEAFSNQTREISRLLVDKEKERLLKKNKNKMLSDEDEKALINVSGISVVSKDSEKVVSLINDRFKLAVKEMQKKTQMLINLQTGDNYVEIDKDDPSATSYGVIWQKQMIEMIEKNNLQALDLAKNGIQLFQTGWIAEQDPSEFKDKKGARFLSVQHMVLMNKDELRGLTTSLENLTKKWSPRTLESSWRESLDKLTSGEVSNLQKEQADTPAKLMQLYSGIKVQNEDGLLTYSFDELNKKTALELQKTKERLEEKINKLIDIIDEKEFTYVKTEKEGRVFLKRKDPVGKDKKYWWGSFQDDQLRDQRAWIERTSFP